jgi:hypothetical protein
MIWLPWPSVVRFVVTVPLEGLKVKVPARTGVRCGVTNVAVSVTGEPNVTVPGFAEAVKASKYLAVSTIGVALVDEA